MKYSLSEREKKFLVYWAEERKRSNKKTYFFIKGIRNASYLIIAIILSLTTGWYKRISFLSPGLMVSFFIACFILTIFISIFTAYYGIEQNEQRYWELKQLQKQDIN